MQIINKYVNLKLTELTCLNVLPENPRLWAILKNHKAALLVPIYLKEETKNITVTKEITQLILGRQQFMVGDTTPVHYEIKGFYVTST